MTDLAKQLQREADEFDKIVGSDSTRARFTNGLLDGISSMLGLHTSRTLKLRAEVDQLRRRVDLLEQQAFAFDGAHAAGKLYPPNRFVVRSGGLWVSVAETATTPGTDEGAKAWRLCCKRGDFTGYA